LAVIYPDTSSPLFSEQLGSLIDLTLAGSSFFSLDIVVPMPADSADGDTACQAGDHLTMHSLPRRPAPESKPLSRCVSMITVQDKHRSLFTDVFWT